MPGLMHAAGAVSSTDVAFLRAVPQAPAPPFRGLPAHRGEGQGLGVSRA